MDLKMQPEMALPGATGMPTQHFRDSRKMGGQINGWDQLATESPTIVPFQGD